MYMHLLTRPNVVTEALYHYNLDETHILASPGKLSFTPVKVLLEQPVDMYNQKKFDCELCSIKFYGCVFTELEFTENVNQSTIIATMSYDYFEATETK